MADPPSTNFDTTPRTQPYTTLRSSLYFYHNDMDQPVGSEVALVVRVLPGVQQVVVVDVLPVRDILTLYTHRAVGSWVKKMSKGDLNLMR
jgi:hypothetical protein